MTFLVLPLPIMDHIKNRISMKCSNCSFFCIWTCKNTSSNQSLCLCDDCFRTPPASRQCQYIHLIIFNHLLKRSSHSTSKPINRLKRIANGNTIFRYRFCQHPTNRTNVLGFINKQIRIFSHMPLKLFLKSQRQPEHLRERNPLLIIKHDIHDMLNTINKLIHFHVLW